MSSNAPDVVTEAALYLSPPFLLIPAIWARMPTDHYVVGWWLSTALVSVVNGLLYAAVGAVVAAVLRLRKPKKNARSSY
jgi:Co/Zn/Cd efflux system component